MNIQQTRDMVRAALDGALEGVPTITHPVFGVEVPTAVPDVPAEVLDPRGTWADAAAYDEQARRLAAMFVENFERFAGRVDAQVVAAGPRP
jgi:phosphoenolpyruvate carboxykinase (ATP)